MTSVLIKLLKCLCVIILFIFVLYNFLSAESIKTKLNTKSLLQKFKYTRYNVQKKEYNVWITLTKVIEKSPLTFKFKNLITNMLNISSVPLQFHIFIDENSKPIALEYFEFLTNHKGLNVSYKFYDVAKAASKITDIVNAMTPFFSSRPGTYYSDALFYLSLGLHRIAPETQKTAVMLDCDVYFKEDVALLFNELDSFQGSNLFGLAPELSPVYHHILTGYRMKHKTSFGEYYHKYNISEGPHPKGFQGYNSGVVLLNLEAIRKSKNYTELIKPDSVAEMASKYNFRGHLGDQDFYTLLGFEHPTLIKTLNCGFNKQLCTWWRDNGYKDIFDFYFKCDHKLVLLHGNCNTRVPTN